MAFKVQTPDGAWHLTDDLTFAEVEAIEESTGIAWWAVNPMRSLACYRAIIGAFALRGGMDEAALAEWLNTRTARDLRDGIKAAADDMPETFQDGLPLAEGAPSTSTSAGAPSDTDGPPSSSGNAPSET